MRVGIRPVATTAERIEQRVMFVEKADKRPLLRQVLKDRSIDRVLVFTRTKHGADRVVKQLAQDGVAADAIHGNKSQNARTRALERFRSGAGRVLVATDIAARGIDVDGVSHVINYDLPNVPESYVHRIGRTARAGNSGDRDLVLRCRGARLSARHRDADQGADPGGRGSPVAFAGAASAGPPRRPRRAAGSAASRGGRGGTRPAAQPAAGRRNVNRAAP